MSKRNIILIILVIVFIIIFVSIRSRKNNIIVNNIVNENVKKLDFNKIIDETTKKEKYVLYDKTTGEEKLKVDEYQLKIYETNPDYEELPVISDVPENFNYQ